MGPDPDVVRLVESAIAQRNPKRRGDETYFTCPNTGAHKRGDQKPSARWNHAKATLYCDVCHAQGGANDLAKMLDLSLPKPERKRAQEHSAATYHIYCAADGKPLRRKARIGAGDKKKIWWEVPDGAGGWVKATKGAGNPGVLYRLPELQKAIEEGRPIYLPEGEKCCEILTRTGLECTTNPEGATPDGRKWRQVYTDALRGTVEVVILEDNDPPGKAHAEAVARILRTAGIKVRIVHFPELPLKGDVWDFLQKHTKEELLARVESTPLWTPTPRLVTTTAPALLAREFKPLKELVPGLIVVGLIVLAGAPKAGKSFLALAIAVAKTLGMFVLGAIEVAQAEVLYLALEDSPRRMKDRLEGMLAGDGCQAPEGLHLLTLENAIPRLGEGLSEWLSEWLDAHLRVELVIVDTFQKLRGPRKARNGGDLYAEDYAEATALQELALRRGIAILLIHHTRKAADADNPFNEIIGSTGLPAAADALLVLKTKRGTRQGTLTVTGRDIESAELAIERDILTGGWRLLGDAREVNLGAAQKAVLDVFGESEDDVRMSISGVARRLKKSYGSVKNLIYKLADKGELGLDPEHHLYQRTIKKTTSYDAGGANATHGAGGA